MRLEYFKNKKINYEENFDEKIKTLYLSTVEKLHKQFDRHYNYYDENKEYVNSIKTINDSYGTNQKIYAGNWKIYD